MTASPIAYIITSGPYEYPKATKIPQNTPKDATTGDQKTLKRHQKTIKEAKRPQK